MGQFDERILKDRRKRPTAGLSRYTLWGRRKTFQRKEEQKRGGYVDRYRSASLFPIVLAVGLSVLDALFTMMILDDGGWEANPVVRSVIQLYGDRFWIWKFAMISFPLILLCIHSKFRWVTPAILGICTINIFVILYEILLFIF